MINLYDASALVYVGEAIDREDNARVSEDNCNGMPVAGIRYALKKILTHDCPDETNIVICDSPTNKNEYFSAFKNTRKFDPKIAVQKEFLKLVLPCLGVTTVYQDNFEADDLFYNIIYEEIISGTKEHIRIFSDDADITGAMIAPNITRPGIVNGTPTLTVDNYSQCCKSKVMVPYNTVLAYHMFCGKPSNNICSMKNGSRLYHSFLDFMMEKEVPQYLGSDWSTLVSWSKWVADKGLLEKGQLTEISKRKEVIYPRMGYNKEKAYHKPNVNKDRAGDYLILLNEIALCNQLGLPIKPVSEINKSILDRFVKMYRSGANNIDCGLTADTSFFFDSSDKDNVGGF